MNLIKYNKKGQSGNGTGIMLIVIFVGILFVLMFIGIAMALGGMVIDWTFDETVPLFSDIGSVGAANFTEISKYTITPLNNIVQSFTWLSGVLYIMALVGMIGLAMAFRITGNKWLMAFFIGCMFMLVIGSIFISNIYEDFYDDVGGVGDRLHEYSLLSFLVLYSPMLMCVIGFVGGIIMFSGYNSEGEI